MYMMLEKELTVELGSHSETFIVEDVEFKLNSSQTSLDIIMDTFGPYKKPAHIQAANKKVNISLEHEEPNGIRELLDLSHEVFYKNRGVECGRADNCYYSISRDGYGSLVVPMQGHLNFTCWGSRPDLGALSIMKMELLKRYRETSNDFLCFHGGSVVDQRTGGTIVISGSDYNHPRGNVSGKTTALLSLVLHEESPFAYCSNDEVLLGANEHKSIDCQVLPSMIAVRGGTLRGLQKDGLLMKSDEWSEMDRTSGEETRFITPNSIVEAGGKILGGTSSVPVWIFTDLSADHNITVLIGLVIERQKACFLVTSITRE
jgi:hypothetical protein